MDMAPKKTRTSTPLVRHSGSPWMRIKPWLPIAIPALSLVVALWVYRGKFSGALSDSHEHWGQFGDYLGGLLNPIVGLITLLLLVRTLELQRKELQEQREEIKHQNSILMRQTIEQALFAWIKDYKSQVESFKYCVEYDESDGSPLKWERGVSAIRALVWGSTNRWAFSADSDTQAAVRRVAAEATDVSLRDLSLSLAYCVQNWEINSEEYVDQVGGMLRTLYGLFKWIDHTDLAPLDKFQYASIVRARLSSSELEMLFLNGMTAKGTRFVKYIHRYALFDNYSSAGNILLDAIKSAPTCRYTRRAYSSSHARMMLQYADNRRTGKVKGNAKLTRETYIRERPKTS